MATSITDEERRRLPDETALKEAGEVKIKAKDGNEIPLKSLYGSKPAEERQLIVFIRHFFCGSCEQYIEALSRDLSPAKLAAANTTLTIIGNGDHSLIPDYTQRTGCPYTIYTESSVEIHKKLGMISSLKNSSKQADYIHKSFMKNVIDSTWNALVSGRPLSAGPSAQNGGEFLFQNGELKWCSRMRNPTDHTEIQELKEVLGIKD